MLVGIGGIAVSELATRKPQFIPTNLSGLLAWVKADLGAKDSGGNLITTDNTTVYTLTDQSGNNNHLTNLAGTGPKWRSGANGQNNRPILTFDGTQFLSFATNVTPQSNFTYFIVLKGTRSGALGYANRAQGTVANSNTGFTIGVTPTDFYVVVRPAAASPSLDFNANGTYTNTVLGTVTLGTGGGKLRVNKTEVASNVNATAWGLSGAATEYVGRDMDVLFQGNICEIIIYNSILSANNIASVEEYLSSKWKT